MNQKYEKGAIDQWICELDIPEHVDPPNPGEKNT